MDGQPKIPPRPSIAKSDSMSSLTTHIAQQPPSTTEQKPPSPSAPKQRKLPSGPRFPIPTNLSSENLNAAGNGPDNVMLGNALESNLIPAGIQSGVQGDDKEKKGKKWMNNIVNSAKGILHWIKCTILIIAYTGIFNQDSGINKSDISAPYAPVHLTHVGINQDTGEFTVMTENTQ